MTCIFFNYTQSTFFQMIPIFVPFFFWKANILEIFSAFSSLKHESIISQLRNRSRFTQTSSLALFEWGDFATSVLLCWSFFLWREILMSKCRHRHSAIACIACIYHKDNWLSSHSLDNWVSFPVCLLVCFMRHKIRTKLNQHYKSRTQAQQEKEETSSELVVVATLFLDPYPLQLSSFVFWNNVIISSLCVCVCVRVSKVLFVVLSVDYASSSNGIMTFDLNG